MPSAMFSFFYKIFSVFFILAITMPSGKAQNTVKSLSQEYIENIAQHELRNAVIGVLAISAEGDTIAAWNAERNLVPASNMKLITTGLALDALGSDFKYKTSIGYSGKVCDGTLNGDLYIIGGGDPLLASDDSIATAYGTIFREWAGFLEDAGIKKIDGHVIGDGRHFGLSMPEEQTWQWDDCGTYYGAGISGLNFFENMQTFDVAAGNCPGDPVSVRIKFPECPWMDYRTKCRTGEAGTGDKLYLYTSDLSPVGEMRGTFAADRAPKTLECSNKFPEYTCAAYFTGWIAADGTDCTEGPADTGIFSDGTAAADADSLEVIGTTLSPSLKRIVYMTNHDSNNIYAETLFHTLGKEVSGDGDYEASRQTAERLLRGMGMDTGTVNIRDGSGLSRHNLLSPSFLCGFLKAMEKSPEFESFVQSLPSPGDGGTLETVMTDYSPGLKAGIRLKSGSMSGVKCFSGYIFPTSGKNAEENRPAVFSIMMNNSPVSQYRMQKMADRLIFLISTDITRREAE